MHDKEINEIGLWREIFATGDFFSHRNFAIKRDSIKFFSNVICTVEYSDIIAIAANFELYNSEGFLTFLQQRLLHEEDETILISILSVVSVLLFYGHSRRDLE